MIKTINGAMFRKMILNGAKLLDSNKQHVDSLNVFPVPDGDTGTNMSLTMIAAAKEISACPNNNIDALCDALAKGALRGARGNSGVITSQILKGMSNELSKCESGEISSKDFAVALESGTQIAYKAVTKPQEGTILTVIRTMSEHAAKLSRKTIGVPEFFQSIIKVGEETLKQTPEMLPVLKKAGVVDAGGRGLLIVFQGFYNSLVGKEEVNLDFDDSIRKPGGGNNYEQFHVDLQSLDVIEFAYCTEFFVIHLNEGVGDADVDSFRNKLMEIGDSVLVIGDLSMVKVHVHTNQPGVVLTHALELGEIDKNKIENMLEQNREMQSKRMEDLKPFGLVSICAGEGLTSIFRDLLVDNVIEGGQTMNPSAEDIALACDKVPAENIFVYPNNKNIILAAEQAKNLSKRKLHIIPTRNIPEGLSAVLSFNQEDTLEDNIKNMNDSITGIKAGMVTYAVRSTQIDNFDLKEGDIIGMDSNSIVAKGEEVKKVTKELVGKMIDNGVSTITLYFGNNVKEEEATAVAYELSKEYKRCDVDIHFGSQPLYYYIISLE